MSLAHAMPSKGYGQMTRSRMTNELVFSRPWVEPLHIFFRFAGISRHDPPGESTPTLGAVGLHRTLGMMRSEQAAATTITVMLNGVGDTTLHREWFGSRLAPMCRVELVRAPSGLRQSFKFQQAHHGRYTHAVLTHCNATELFVGGHKVLGFAQELILKSVKQRHAIVFVLEEDYLHTANMLPQLLSFFHAYNPCIVVPYGEGHLHGLTS